jgi:hypothetical protein
MSTSSGRYQSSLFSFFSQQSLRFKDKAQQVWRKAKTAAVWGAQIALYPIYLLFQSGRLVGKQMGNAARQFLQVGAGQPEIPPSDTPIQKALAAATQWFVQAEQPGALLDSAVAIQGIASRLSDRGLVLVTVDAQILDLLTPEQQAVLQRRIVWEMAIHWRQHRLERLEGQGGAFLPLPQEQPQALPPVRLFQQLMAWMQQSPVAIATNLFQESRLALQAAEPIDVLYPHDLDSGDNHFPVFQWIKNQSTDLSQMLNKLLDSSLVLYDPIAPVEPEPDLPSLPELTIEEFFSGEFIGVAVPVSAPLEKAIVLTVQPPAAVQPTVKTSLTRKPVARKPKVVENTAIGVQESALAKPLEAKIAHPDAPPAPTLEAEVEVVGYEKHPLEQLLAWLDGGMLWLEQKLGEIWRWLRQR